MRIPKKRSTKNLEEMSLNTVTLDIFWENIA